MTLSHSARHTLSRLLFLAVATGCLVGVSTAAATAATATTYRVLPSNAARLMWQTGPGYCGETSLQIVGIQMGFWVGQNQTDKLRNCKPAALCSASTTTRCSPSCTCTTRTGPAATPLADRQNFIDWIRDAP